MSTKRNVILTRTVENVGLQGEEVSVAAGNHSMYDLSR